MSCGSMRKVSITSGNLWSLYAGESVEFGAQRYAEEETRRKDKDTRSTEDTLQQNVCFIVRLCQCLGLTASLDIP